MLNKFYLNRRGIRSAVLATVLLSPVAGVALAAAFEGPLTFNAADFLAPTPLKNANYTINSSAQNDGLMNHYKISSPFGSLEAIGDAMARERAREMNAIAAIRLVKKTDAYLNGLGAAIDGPLQATKTLITKPIQTVQNLGTTAKEMVGNLMTAISSFGKKESDDSTAMLKDFIGYNKSKRVLAGRLGVDPYSSNPYLQKELGDLAWAGFAGGATIDVAISAATVGGVGATVSAINMGAATGGIFLTKSLTSLTTLNTKYLADMGLIGKAADPFLFHAKYPVPHQTLLVLALGAMQDIPGRTEYIHLATAATNLVQTRFYQRTAQIMAAYHQQVRPVKRIIVNQGWASFVDADGRAIMPVPADYMAWTPNAAAIAKALPAGHNRALWTTGFVSPMARAGLTGLGIGVEEKIFARRIKDSLTIIAPKAVQAEARKAAAEKSEPSGLQNMFDSIGKLIPEPDAPPAAKQ